MSPSPSAATSNSGDSGERMKVRARLPASPSLVGAPAPALSPWSIWFWLAMVSSFLSYLVARLARALSVVGLDGP